MTGDTKVDPMSPYKEAPEEIQRIMKAVLDFEKERLFLQRVKYNDEITKIVMEEIK